MTSGGGFLTDLKAARAAEKTTMDLPTRGEEYVLSSIFSDETELFRSPQEPRPGDVVTIRLRMAKGSGAQIVLMVGSPTLSVPMKLVRTDACFDWFEGSFACGDQPVFYSFSVEWHGKHIHYLRTGARKTAFWPIPVPEESFRFRPGFAVPAWAKGALQYQILTDRFRSGDPANSVCDREYFYSNDYVSRATDWDACPRDGDYRCFYGGDLAGVMEKLDYLQSLGVEVIYFNPIFVSPSSHKYDTQDYEHIDPHLTRVCDDGGDALAEGDTVNLHASRYIRRVASAKNLADSDAFFAGFCEEVHRRGMRIILDGVFNHCGSFHKWMDREGIYRHREGFASGAYGDPGSPYRGYFKFKPGTEAYESWWDVPTLPKLNYEGSEALCEEIFRVAQHWVSPPYSIDGWRLDVAADLGHSAEYNHRFWKEFRRRVKAVNPNVVLVAEHYGDPSAWLGGDEWDTVMNYDAFMEPVTWFLTGMDKHSDRRDDALYQNGPAFFERMRSAMLRLPGPSLQSAMNQLSNHDHSRFLTRTNRMTGRVGTAGSAAAGENVDKRVLREAAVIQMTWPGSPTIYYADEAGQVGWTDPDNRRTYPWGREDRSLIDLHRSLAALHRRPVLRQGSLMPLCAGTGYIAYARFDRTDLIAVACNNADEEQILSLPIRAAGAADGDAFRVIFRTDEDGFSDAPGEAITVADGCLRLVLPPRSAVVTAAVRS